MTKQVCIHCLITGKVQGVFFRASTKAEAEKLNLTGWAKNLADGRVEVFACGDEEAVDKLITWLKKGPRLARVTSIQTEFVPWETHFDFNIRK